METPVKPLGDPTKHEREDDPPGCPADEDRQGWRQAGEGQHQDRPNEGAEQGNGGSD